MRVAGGCRTLQQGFASFKKMPRALSAPPPSPSTAHPRQVCHRPNPTSMHTRCTTATTLLAAAHETAAGGGRNIRGRPLVPHVSSNLKRGHLPRRVAAPPCLAASRRSLAAPCSSCSRRAGLRARLQAIPGHGQSSSWGLLAWARCGAAHIWCEGERCAGLGLSATRDET